MDYGYSSEVSAEDERQDIWKKQREERGFDDTELWGLDCTIARFILPRLKEFKKQAGGYPSNLKPEGDDGDKGLELWENSIQTMIDAFELIAKDHVVTDDKEKEIIETGLDNFRKYYFSLWN